MRKFLSLLLVALLAFSLGTVSALAADETAISVTTPVEMTLVSQTDGNYEYKVSLKVSVSENSVAVSDKEVSILMFANRDNTAFVAGDNVLNLTVAEIAANYYVYHVNQGTTNSQGKVEFDFNIDLPSPAKNDAYYIWVGAEGSDAPEELGLEDLSVSSTIVAVTLTASGDDVTAGEGVTLTPDAVNVFGNSVPGAEYSYNVTQNNTSVDASIENNILSTYSLSGLYTITVTAKAVDGTIVTSDGITVSVDNAVILGDTDGNNRINIQDAVAALKHAVGITTLEGASLTAADIDKSGAVDIDDGCQILRYIARIITQF